MNEAVKQIGTQPWVPIEVWCKAVGVGRNTAYKLAARGEVEGVFRAVDTEDNTGALTAVQAARLIRQFKLSETLARTVAELAFANGRAP